VTGDSEAAPDAAPRAWVPISTFPGVSWGAGVWSCLGYRVRAARRAPRVSARCRTCGRCKRTAGCGDLAADPRRRSPSARLNASRRRTELRWRRQPGLRCRWPCSWTLP